MDLKSMENLKAEGVVIHSAPADIYLGAGIFDSMEIEVPCEFRSGFFEIGKIGAFSYLGGGSASIRNVKEIGRFCAIAGNVVVGQVEHPTNFLSPHPMFQGKWGKKWPMCEEFESKNSEMIQKSLTTYLSLHSAKKKFVTIGNDVWIGEGAYVASGVTIGDGAIIGARSVVTKDVAPYEIAIGSPARPLRSRFHPEIVGRLLALKWWNYGLSALDGVDFTDIEAAIDAIQANIDSGRAEIFNPPLKTVSSPGA
jgi:acetyltransferase-like isoleucine patch superfamily enzyme